MASDISLLIIAPETSTVVCTRWIGGNSTRDRVWSVLSESPDNDYKYGAQYWGPIKTEQAIAIAEAAYADGVQPEEISALAIEFPDNTHWWVIERDY